jgi:hypothetical protein
MQASDPWGVIGYEVKMFKAACKILFKRSYFNRLTYPLKNAVEEAAVLHARNLCEIFLSKRRHDKDDIIIDCLFPDWDDAKYTPLKDKITTLDGLYGRNTVTDKEKPCWNFNKRLAHSTTHRGSEYDYRKFLNDLYCVIEGIIAEIESDAVREKPFDLHFHGPTCPPTLFWC